MKTMTLSGHELSQIAAKKISFEQTHLIVDGDLPQKTHLTILGGSLMVTGHVLAGSTIHIAKIEPSSDSKQEQKKLHQNRNSFWSSFVSRPKDQINVSNQQEEKTKYDCSLANGDLLVLGNIQSLIKIEVDGSIRVQGSCDGLSQAGKGRGLLHAGKNIEVEQRIDSVELKAGRYFSCHGEIINCLVRAPYIEANDITGSFVADEDPCLIADQAKVAKLNVSAFPLSKMRFKHAKQTDFMLLKSELILDTLRKYSSVKIIDSGKFEANIVDLNSFVHIQNYIHRDVQSTASKEQIARLTEGLWSVIKINEQLFNNSSIRLSNGDVFVHQVNQDSRVIVGHGNVHSEYIADSIIQTKVGRIETQRANQSRLHVQKRGNIYCRNMTASHLEIMEGDIDAVEVDNSSLDVYQGQIRAKEVCENSILNVVLGRVEVNGQRVVDKNKVGNYRRGL